MKKKWIAFLVGTVLVGGFVVLGAKFAKSESTEVHGGTIRIENQAEAQFPSMAKISLEQAVREASASVQGRVLKVELDDEDGFLVYEVRLAGDDKSVSDVMVDAGSGKVLGVEHLGKAGEHQESDDQGERECDD